MLYGIIGRYKKTDDLLCCFIPDSQQGDKLTSDKALADADCEFLNAEYGEELEYVVVEFKGD